MRIRLTGYSDLASIVGSINDGEIYRFISKPWDSAELRKTVAEGVTIALELANTKTASAELPGQMEAGVLVIDKGYDLQRVARELVGSRCPVFYAPNLEAALPVMLKHEIAVVIADVEAGPAGWADRAGQPSVVVVVPLGTVVVVLVGLDQLLLLLVAVAV